MCSLLFPEIPPLLSPLIQIHPSVVSWDHCSLQRFSTLQWHLTAPCVWQVIVSSLGTLPASSVELFSLFALSGTMALGFIFFYFGSLFVRWLMCSWHTVLNYFQVFDIVMEHSHTWYSGHHDKSSYPLSPYEAVTYASLYSLCWTMYPHALAILKLEVCIIPPGPSCSLTLS